MYRNDSNNMKVEKQPRGWNRKGFRWDKNSEEYKRYFARHKKSRTRTIRRKLETLAKAPLSGRVYQSKYGRCKKRTEASNS